MPDDTIVIDDWMVHDLLDFKLHRRWGTYVLHFERGKIVRREFNFSEKTPLSIELPKGDRKKYPIQGL